MAYGRNTRRYGSSSRSRGGGRAGGGRRSPRRSVRRLGGGARVRNGRGSTVKIQLQVVGQPATAASPFLGQELKEIPKGRSKF